MRKIIIYTLIALLVIIAILVITPFVKMLLDSQNPLRKSEDDLLKNMLELTPIGVSMDDVLNIIENNNEWKISYVDHDYGISQGEFGKPGEPIGEKSIRITAGKYTGIYRKGSILAMYIYSKVDVYVTIWWGFDENSKLIDIHLKKDIAGF